MLKKTVAIGGVVALVAVLGLFAVGSVYAQDPTPTPGPGAPTTKVPRGGAWGRICRGFGVVSDAVADLLGMTKKEILAERAAGKTLSEIAKEKGVSDQQVIDAMVAAEQEVIERALSNGKITQAQADWLIARMKALAPFELTNPFGPRAGWRGRCGGCGKGGWAKPTPTRPAPSGT